MAAPITVYGTLTSPYVRRVRAVAHELGAEVDLVDAFTEDGQAQLRAASPLWKVPAAKIDGTLVFDSSVIVDTLIRRDGGATSDAVEPIAPDDLRTRNIVTVVDGVLDALINVFYLDKDGISAAQSTYVTKQLDRARASMGWLDEQLDGVWLSPNRRFGVAELALTTTLGWMRFRDRYPVADHLALLHAFETHDARPSMAATRPPGT